MGYINTNLIPEHDILALKDSSSPKFCRLLWRFRCTKLVPVGTGAFRALSNIYDGAFCKHIKWRFLRI